LPKQRSIRINDNEISANPNTKIKDVRNNLGAKTSREELFDDERRRRRSANPRVRATRGGRKSRMNARAGAGRRLCRVKENVARRQQRLMAAAAAQAQARCGGGGGAADGGCAGAVDARL
jgi:hypothetical protein